ncbi:MAG: single-stranded DNA-binding protein [Acidimicrobiia bacterium]
MDLNLVVLSGTLASSPELRVFDSGSCLIRYLVSVRAEEPRRRVDVVPVTLWDPPETLLNGEAVPGRRIWVAGAVQRRFWDAPEGRRSRLEIVAEQVEVRPEEGATVV